MLFVSFVIFILLMVIGTPIAFAMGLSGVIGIVDSCPIILAKGPRSGHVNANLKL